MGECGLQRGKMYQNPIDELRYEAAEIGHVIEEMEKRRFLSDFQLGKLIAFRISFKKMMKVIDKFNKQQ